MNSEKQRYIFKEMYSSWVLIFLENTTWLTYEEGGWGGSNGQIARSHGAEAALQLCFLTSHLYVLFHVS